MKTTFKALMIAVTILAMSITVSLAQDFEKGMEAYQNGDYATALSIWLPLAEQGDADVSHHPDQKDDGACNTAKLPHNIDEKMNQSPY